MLPRPYIGLRAALVYLVLVPESVLPDSTAAVRLQAMDIVPYDGQAVSDLPEQLVSVSSLVVPGEPDAGGAPRFDFTWVTRAAKRSRVIVFGETHHNRIIRDIGEQFVSALNELDDYRTVSLEVPLSATPFYDHYVGLSRDEEATQFAAVALKPFLYDAELLQLLDSVRSWNKGHPRGRIHVVAHDLEHDDATTVWHVLVPYLRERGIECPIPSTYDGDELGRVVEQLSRCMQSATQQRRAGGFLRPAMARAILENLRSTWYARHYDQGFSYYRQRAIVRNLTDSRFLGRFWRDGKLFLWVGGFHAASRERYPDGAGFLREASYFQHDYSPTRGKVYSILAMGYALTVDESCNLEAMRHRYVSRDYLMLMEAFTRARNEGLLAPEQAFLFKTPLNELDRLLLRLAAQHGDVPLMVEGVNWDELVRAAGASKGARAARAISSDRQAYGRYDRIMMVPKSPVTHACP